MRKVLLILYYWPPSGGAGVQRCLKLVKYLRDFGWEPIVFTAENAAYPILDESLFDDVPEGQEVVRSPIWEPYEVYKRFTGQKKGEKVYSGFLSEDKKPSLTQRLSIWIRGNFFIPDARRFWVKPALRTLEKYLSEHPVEAVISSGPPHTTHLIARGVKRRFGIPWIADFRDPWTNIDFYHQLQLTGWADRKHRRLEQSVMRESDKLVTVSWSWAEEFRELGADPVHVITNGFDHADFEFEPGEPDADFSFNHIGYLNADRNPPQLWEAFGELCKEIPGLKEKLKLRFIGKTDFVVFDALEKLGLADCAERIDYLPHNEVVKTLTRAQVLLLLINNTPNVMGVIPGKIFEYLAARRPILGVGLPEGDAARILRESGVGKMVGFEAKEEMKRQILALYKQYKRGELNVAEADIDRFPRRSATGQMAGLLDELVGK